MTDARVLLIEDEEDSRLLLRRVLERTGMTVIEATTGTQGLRELYGSHPDVVLLDIGLPEIDGWRTLERIRELTDMPVMMVTGKASELEKVRALRSGADDYVTKPFGLQEIVARVEALLRRGGPAKEPPRAYTDELVEIDFQGAEARADGRVLELTPLEYRLLSAFVQHPNQVLSADQLLELAWGESGFGRERVKIYVGYLRGKFRDVGAEAPIETIRGFGYRYRPPSHRSEGYDTRLAR
jgi:DNA-binding response OmpR family regulator